MKIDESGNLIHEDYAASFMHDGRQFIVDEYEDYFLVTEQNFTVKRKGKTFEEAKKNAIEAWDSYQEKQSNDNSRKILADIAKKGAAINNLGSMCKTCAFKLDSDANLEPHNVDAAWQCVAFQQADFNCHKEIGVDAEKKCVGFQHAKQYYEQLTNNNNE